MAVGGGGENFGGVEEGDGATAAEVEKGLSWRFLVVGGAL